MEAKTHAKWNYKILIISARILALRLDNRERQRKEGNFPSLVLSKEVSGK